MQRAKLLRSFLIGLLDEVRVNTRRRSCVRVANPGTSRGRSPGTTSSPEPAAPILMMNRSRPATRPPDPPGHQAHHAPYASWIAYGSNSWLLGHKLASRLIFDP